MKKSEKSEKAPAVAAKAPAIPAPVLEAREKIVATLVKFAADSHLWKLYQRYATLEFVERQGNPELTARVRAQIAAEEAKLRAELFAGFTATLESAGVSGELFAFVPRWVSVPLIPM